MYFLLIGIVGLVLKYFEAGPFAEWSWWYILIPFPLAIVWWWWADTSGYTKKKEIEKMEQRKQDRIKKQKEAMGRLTKGRR